MYRNLKKLRKERKVTIKKMADALGVGTTSISYKISRHRFYIEEALQLRDAFFPDCSIEYLFKTETEVKE